MEKVFQVVQLSVDRIKRAVQDGVIFVNKRGTLSRKTAFYFFLHKIIYSTSKCCFIKFKYWRSVPLILLIDSWNTNTQRYEVPSINFQTFFVWALLSIVHTWNSSPLRSNLLRLQCTCCAVPATSGRPHGSPLVWACQGSSSQPLSSPQLSHELRE